MFQQNGESGKLFSKCVPVTIKEGHSNQCRNSSLFLTVEWLETAAAIHRQELKISLTDNNDPFFLYNLHLSEEDFQMLKSSQGLLVDFSAFPQKFIDLLEVCLAEDSKNQPKFLLIFDVSDRIGTISSLSQLDIVETNPFKHLVHLSLKFLPGSESAVKQYLAACFKNLKESKHQLESRLTYLEQDFKDKLSTCESKLEKKTLELETVRKELSVELSMKESRHSRELQEEREKFLSKQREEESRSERDRREREQSLRREIQQLESRVSCLESLNKDLEDQNHKREGTIRDLRARILSYEDDVKRLKDTINNLKDQNSAFQNENRDKKIHLSHQKEKIEELTQDLRKKKQLVEQLQEQCDLHHRNKKALEKESEEIKHRLHERSKECDKLSQHIEKANDVIKKLQMDIDVLDGKLRSRTAVINRLELNCSEKGETVLLMQKELKELKTENKKKITEAKILNDTVTSLQDKINILEKDIKAKDNVIKFLNRELTDRCAIPRYAPPAHLTPSSTNSNQALTINEAEDTVATNLNLFSSDDNEKPKSLPSRISLSPLPSPPNGMPNSAFKPNSKPTELSPDLGSGQTLKHSTAKKFSTSRSGNSSRKKP